MITSTTAVRSEGGFPRVRVRTMCIGMLVAMTLPLLFMRSAVTAARLDGAQKGYASGFQQSMDVCGGKTVSATVSDSESVLAFTAYVDPRAPLHLCERTAHPLFDRVEGRVDDGIMILP